MYTALDLAKKTRLFLATEKDWTKGTFKVFVREDVDSPLRICRCLIGAISDAENELLNEHNISFGDPESFYVYKTLTTTIREETCLRTPERKALESLTRWNDNEQTTFEDVAKVLDATIARLST